ncbi:MAG: hypothetical protein M1837_001245 [Sclerophora amabilis]|nr:MAG: hypothetical protein M1837_001245 [Sclerophora amabilis]
MADFSFGGSDEENAELKKFHAEVLEEPDNFEHWEKLLRAAEALEGGLNRNSSPQAIAATRDIYDRFLAKFPLLFGYWKKYAEMEFSIAGTEAAEMVYERGVASITNSVDLWTNYCGFKVETSHDSDIIRELFERGANCVGLDFLAHPFWDKYLEFEERLDAWDKIFAILDRVVHIPMHQYARYFERYRQLAHSRPLEELLPPDTLQQFRQEIETEGPTTVQAGTQQLKADRGEMEIEREMRTRIDNFHLEIFSRTQTETTKRWTYESEIKRPYFHVTELDEGQLVNWRKYLDFEEVEGDTIRAQFLYERCLVTCAFYDEFWSRYARWMLAQKNKEEEVRNIYQRASMLYVPISRPAIRLRYACFEEMFGRVEIAQDIHKAILVNLPGHIETIVSWANLQRRTGGLEAAIEVYKDQIDSRETDIYAKAALVAEWARLLWKIRGSAEEARQVYQKNQHWYLDSRAFWINYLFFELEQPTSIETEKAQYQRIKQVHDDIRRKSHLPPPAIKDLTHYYMVYLLERGTKDAAKEYMTLDREVNGPFSVQTVNKTKLAEDGQESTTERRMMMENGHPGVEVDEAAIRRGENPYTKYYQQQGEQPVPSEGQTLGDKDCTFPSGQADPQNPSMEAPPDMSSGSPQEGLTAINDTTLDGYNTMIEGFREEQYPMLKDAVYLDHAGTTLYAKSLIEMFSSEMMSNLLGNPHSASPSSQLSTTRVDDIRLRVLQFLNADPEEFDVVFVANATAGCKLVMEALRDHSTGPGEHASNDGFWYGYHRDSHTSLVGIREAARAGHRCFESDEEVEQWLSKVPDAENPDMEGSNEGIGLFSYPAQSNFNGRRLPLDWPLRLRNSRLLKHRKLYTMLDAAALVSTSPLDLRDAPSAPDFTVLSFYKIFGFPDLGALIIRKDSGHVFQKRKYFGGGTVDMVVSLKEQWHERKSLSLHDQLEDGTLPIHNIVALGAALDTHQQLYGTIGNVSKHTSSLAQQLYEGLSRLRHCNDKKVCELYRGPSSSYKDRATQGPVIAFNIRNSKGSWISNAEVEKLATIKNIHLRTGGVCNPGGIASSLNLAPWEMRQNFSAGQRCGNDTEVISGKPTGVIRVSLGAMSTVRDVTRFLDFVREFFVERTIQDLDGLDCMAEPMADSTTDFRVESLMIYPIKSCGGWKVPPATAWDVNKEGLAWDREWCVVHLGTGTALSQKKYPNMALLRPSIDLEAGVLRIRTCTSYPGSTGQSVAIEVPLSANPNVFQEDFATKASLSRLLQVCGESVRARAYTSNKIREFFSAAIGAPCTLARFPPGGSGPSMRHSKLHLQKGAKTDGVLNPLSSARVPQDETIREPILLANESPFLVISRSSLNRLNEQIKASGGKAARAEVFRANIVLSEDFRITSGNEHPYVEDSWRYLQVGQQYFQVCKRRPAPGTSLSHATELTLPETKILGPCRRCQMVCVDQNTAEVNQEPFVTLAKTRKKSGKVYFGQHTCHLPRSNDASTISQKPTIMVGDGVTAFLRGNCP